MIKGIFKIIGWCIFIPFAFIKGMLEAICKTYK